MRVRVNPPLQECIRLGATHAAVVVVHGGPRGVSGARRQADVGAETVPHPQQVEEKPLVLVRVRVRGRGRGRGRVKG